MSLSPGTRLGPYEIVSAIGAGGMGVVYRAHDTKLGRDVALKVLPDAFAADPERVARMHREAQVLASLNHPNIAHVYGLEQADGVQALVMELVQGETLADRIAQGPIPLDEALPIAKQIADALEPAHEQGIIHRDLKPANIKVRPDGTVKVLDFGLAKALAVESAGAIVGDLTASPTMTNPAMTRMGVILGTAAYMSPEQARGREVDKRADVWAFGCVLYEMLTGQVAFPGADVSEVLAGVIKSDVAWHAMPSNTPAQLRAVIRRCLQKDPKYRLRDIGDARLEIQELLATPRSETTGAAAVPRRTRERLTWSVAGMTLGVALATAFWQPAPTLDTRVYRTSILLPRGFIHGSIIPSSRFTLSPDGRRLAFAAYPSGGALLQLWVESLDGHPAQPLPGTDGATAPFWSPDGRSIAFYAQGKLKTIGADGGPVVTLAETQGNPGGSWNRDNAILFASSAPGNPIRRVAASGGAVSAATVLDRARGESAHWAPVFLPDGRHFLYVAAGSKTGGPNDLNGIYVTALDSNERKLLVPGGSNAKYARGHLFFMREQALMAQPFDVERLALNGEPVPIAEQVAIGGVSGRLGAFSIYDDVIAYQLGAAGDQSQLAWIDRMGRPLGTVGERGDYGDLELSPNGTRAAVSVSERGNRDIWLFELARGLRTRFTFDQAEENSSTWSADGEHLFFASNRKGGYDIYRKAASGSGDENTVEALDDYEFPLSSSRDGRFMLTVRAPTAAGSGDIWVFPLGGDRKPFPFLKTQFDEYPAVISPDGRWVTYASNESGRSEVYVTSFPVLGGKWQISTAGGSWPRWRRDGKEIFYLAADNRLMAAAINEQASAVDVGSVHPLFQLRARLNRRYMYDASADGQRFLVNTLVEEATEQPITLVVNWPALLKR